ncbi:MAG: DUF2333 family protein [Desulfobacterales bacterium]|nr:DUF2333 family protein [Desulfobacterales bacterium]MBS3756173.1 DUF2333 family protein [Desulfobacterales bacterium]
MEAHGSNPEPIKEEKEYRKFIWIRLLLGICITVGLIWAAVYFADRFVPAREFETAASAGSAQTAEPEKQARSTAESAETKQTEAAAEKTAPSPEQPRPETNGEQAHPEQKPAEETGHPEPESAENGQSQASAAAQHPTKEQPRGFYFMDKLIKPLEYELTERFWGWRPNDLIKFTDNVNELQLGVLETTRRATVYLTERISRRGSAEALDPNLENAMNWLMVNAKNYWFPSPENKYTDAIKELRAYQDRLEQGRASFYIRADNLIPLLKAFEELLGSCDDNLVKLTEEDGEPVSSFQADNYFYYAKGVAMTLDSLLRGVEHDFKRTLEMRNGVDVLEHAIHSCHTAAELDPWLWVTEGSLNGILANHRANMAAHISHARFYVSLLIETLST